MYNLISLFSPGVLISGLVNVASDYRWDSLLTTRKVWGLVRYYGDVKEATGQEKASKPWVSESRLDYYRFSFPPFSPHLWKRVNNAPVQDQKGTKILIRKQMCSPGSHLHSFIPIQRHEGWTFPLQSSDLFLLSHLEPSYSNCC